MNKYKTFEELKEELGNNYDLFMYEINLCLLQKIDKATEEINYMITNADITEIGAIKLKQILGDKENE